MKKSNVFKLSGFGLLAVVVAGAFVFVSHKNTSSSRIELSDWWQEHRQMLHNGTGDHACDCFSPLISYFKIIDTTSEGATFEWDCSQASTYQVRYGDSKESKGNEFPTGIGSNSPKFTKSTVTLKGLKPNTTYHVGPLSMCFTGCTRNERPGLRKTFVQSSRQDDWTFKTKDGVTIVTISGKFLDENQKGIAGVKVTLSGGATKTFTTSATGAYLFDSLPKNTSYTVTPTLAGYIFSPANRTYSGLIVNKSSENFIVDVDPKTAVLSENKIYSVTDYKVAQITAKEVSLTWKTVLPATSMIEYGLTKDYGQKSGLSTVMELEHYIQIFELKEGVTYHARAVSYANDSKGIVFRSPDFTFTTPASEERIANKEQFYNEPNPASNRTMFVYYLYQPVKSVDIDVFSLSGKRIASLACPASTLGEGWNKVAWNLTDNWGKTLTNGLYIYKMKFKTANNELELKSSSLRVAR